MLRYLRALNDSKFLMGIAMLVVNVGSKYVELQLSPGQEAALRNSLGREVLIFAMVFMGTRDIVNSILMTAAFSILGRHVLNEDSRLCLIPGPLRRLRAGADLDGDKVISQKEEEEAARVLARAKRQREMARQRGFVSYLHESAFSSPFEPFI